ncbi:MAG: FAD-binding oxidoreductase [Kofleriaceae bacterium]
MTAPARRRSVWAWGFEDRFPDDAARRGLAQLARALLPHSEPELARLPDADPKLPAPAIACPPALAAIASDAPLDRAAHRRGKSYPDLVAGLRGDFGGAPDLVVRPRDDDEVARVLAECAARRLAVIPFGGGTSVVGGVDSDLGALRDAFAGVVSLDLGELSGLRELDERSRVARLGAGTTGPALEAALGQRGLSLRCYPQSFELSTLGGWLATRAGGHYATGPTHIDELCQALTLITPRGTIATHRHPASGAGPEPVRVALGSEGALGIITEAWMRVVPRPVFRSSASVRFAAFADGVSAARHLAQSGLVLANARLLDAAEARLHRVAFDGSSVLLLGAESADHPVAATLERAIALAAECGGELRGAPRHRDDRARGGADDADAWRKAFLDAPYLQSALVSLGLLCDTFETACTWSAFDAMHRAIVAAVEEALRETCGGGVVSCRFTHLYPDGPAPYYTFLAPAARGGELEQWRAVKAAASDALAAHGGTITHHHAVGRVHVPGYQREVPELWRRGLAALKDSWDPERLLNPGVLGL